MSLDLRISLIAILLLDLFFYSVLLLCVLLAFKDLECIGVSFRLYSYY